MVERIRPAEPETSGPSQAEFSDHLARRIELKSQLARLSKRIGTIDAQWEGIGGDAQDLKDGETLHRMGGLAARTGRVKRFNQVAFWMGLVTYEANGQASAMQIFEAKEVPDAPPAATEARLALARAEMDGYNSGWAGGTPENNPHPPGTELYTTWDSACRDGQREKSERKAAKGQPEVPAADASKTKPEAARRGPGRPRKDAAAPPVASAPAKPQRRKAAAAPPTEAPPAEPSTRPRRRRVAEPAATEAAKPGWQGDRDFTDTNDRSATNAVH
jgi:hypothetical protein